MNTKEDLVVDETLEVTSVDEEVEQVEETPVADASDTEVVEEVEEATESDEEVESSDEEFEFLDEDVLAHPIFLLRVVVPAHGTAVRENVNHGLDLFAFNGSMNERGQRDTLLFRSGTSAMEAIDDREFPALVFR